MTCLIKPYLDVFTVYKVVQGYKKEFSDLCKLPADTVYVGSRKTMEAAETLADFWDAR